MKNYPLFLCRCLQNTQNTVCEEVRLEATFIDLIAHAADKAEAGCDADKTRSSDISEVSEQIGSPA